DERIAVPEEVVVRRGEENVTLPVHEALDGDVIIDAAPEWVRRFSEKISKARTILWNGPLGKYESGGEKGTETLARLIAEADAYSVVGGGDTLTVIAENGLENEF